MPVAGRTIKKIASSKLVKQGGEKLLNSAIDVATNVAADILDGKKPMKESLDENLNSAKKSIASSIRNTNKRMLLEAADAVPRKKIRKGKKKTVFSIRKQGQKGRGFNLFHDG